MSMPTLQELLTGHLDQPILQAAAGTNAGATATEAAVAGKQHYITMVSGWVDAAQLVTMKDDTALKDEIKALADTPFKMVFFPPLRITAGKKAEAKIANSTSDCHITLHGFTVNVGA